MNKKVGIKEFRIQVENFKAIDYDTCRNGNFDIYEDSEKTMLWYHNDEVKNLIKQYHYAKDRLMYLLNVKNL